MKLLMICDSRLEELKLILKRVEKRGAYIFDIEEEIGRLANFYGYSRKEVKNILCGYCESDFNVVIDSLVRSVKATYLRHGFVIIGFSDNYEIMELLKNKILESSVILMFNHPLIDLSDAIEQVSVKSYLELIEKSSYLYELYLRLYISLDNILVLEGLAVLDNFEYFKTVVNKELSLCVKSNWEVGDFDNSSMLKLSNIKTFDKLALNNMLSFNRKLSILYRELRSIAHIKIHQENLISTEYEVLSALNEKRLISEDLIQSLRIKLKNSERKIMKLDKRLQLKESQQVELKSKNVISQYDNKEVANEKDLVAKIIKENDEYKNHLKIIDNKKKNLKSTEKNTKKESYYGAPIRFKNTKEYLIGKLLIDTAREPRKIIKVLNRLEVLKKELARENDRSEKLPQLEDYQDYHEIEGIKKHLSYKLGKEIVSKKGRQKLFIPTNIIKLVIEHKLASIGRNKNEDR